MPAPQHDAPRGGFNFNMPWRITTGSNQVELEYDASGARLIKRKRTGGNVSQVTLDIGELYRQVAQFSPGSSPKWGRALAAKGAGRALWSGPGALEAAEASGLPTLGRTLEGKALAAAGRLVGSVKNPAL